MNQHRAHAKRVRHLRCVLAAGATEATQSEPRDVVAALHGDLLDRVCHALHRDLQEAGGELIRAAALAGGLLDARGERGKRDGRGGGVERLVTPRAEHVWEELRLDSAEQYVRVGHGERPAVAVARGAGLRAGRLRAHAEAPVAKRQGRAAAGCNGVDGQHRRADAHGGNHGVGGARKLSGIQRDVGGRAAHVEPDDFADPHGARGADHADHAARRPR